MTDATKGGSQAVQRTRERSPNYPGHTLETTIGFARKLYDAERRSAVPQESVARALGYSTLNGKSRTAIASLRQYGLIEQVGGNLRLSDLAMEIIHPANAAEEVAAISRAAVTPPLIAEVLSTYPDASDQTIASYLIRQRRFSAEGANRFVEVFRQAKQLASLGVAEKPQDKTQTKGATTESAKTSPPQTPTARAAPPNIGAGMETTWILPGAVATLTVSRQLDQTDIDTLSIYFDTFKRVLEMKAKRAGETTQSAEAPNDGGETQG